MAVTYQTEGVKMPDIKKRETTEWIKTVAASYGKRLGEIAYIFCSDEKILEVNRQYLQHDYYTDIITFDYCEGDRLSGDLFISLDTIRTKLFRIGAYGIEADEEVTAKAVAFTVVESDDICVIIVLQILAVHFEYLLVRAEDVGYFTDSFSVSGGYGFYPFRGFTLLDGWHFHAVCLITNHFIYDLMIYDVRLGLRSCD